VQRQRRSETWGGVYPILRRLEGLKEFLKIGQYLTKLCVGLDYSGLLFWPTLYIYTDVIISCMPEFLISAITCNRASVASENIFEKMREEDHTMQILGPKVGGGNLYRRLLLTEMLRLCKHCDFAKFWTPHFSFLNSTLFRLDSTFWLDSTLKVNYGFNVFFMPDLPEIR